MNNVHTISLVRRHLDPGDVSPSRLKIKSGVKAGLRIGGMGDANHNHTQVLPR